MVSNTRYCGRINNGKNRLIDGVFWVGAVDWNLHYFHGYTTPHGGTYNAYLIVDEKIALVDTMKNAFADEMLDGIKDIVEPRKIDFVISNHVEVDHSIAARDYENRTQCRGYSL